MTKPTRAEMIEHAVDLLHAGTLPSGLTAKLMDEFGLTPAQASDIAQAAFVKWTRREGND